MPAAPGPAQRPPAFRPAPGRAGDGSQPLGHGSAPGSPAKGQSLRRRCPVAADATCKPTRDPAGGHGIGGPSRARERPPPATPQRREPGGRRRSPGHEPRPPSRAAGAAATPGRCTGHGAAGTVREVLPGRREGRRPRRPSRLHRSLQGRVRRGHLCLCPWPMYPRLRTPGPRPAHRLLTRCFSLQTEPAHHRPPWLLHQGLPLVEGPARDARERGRANAVRRWAGRHRGRGSERTWQGEGCGCRQWERRRERGCRDTERGAGGLVTVPRAAQGRHKGSRRRAWAQPVRPDQGGPGGACVPDAGHGGAGRRPPACGECPAAQCVPRPADAGQQPCPALKCYSA